ncbi:TonB-dependent receptor [Parahaliea mediterranea]|uniref:TonB-dependent receptor n=1 Tax=Parahaliea mediterranea TaxID=651086 RepID=A0A939DJ09_9GAMM|nr:TonB-dependent receptor [Parahaliea mediterranea]MBN7798999.1 TonB-dependent receptor [Parahaliea mediterranea]
MTRRSVVTPCACALLLGPSLALAQSGMLEEIIVTAEKRATTVQDTPIAVTAFSGTELDRALISKSLDMQFSVPNMLMSKDNFTTAAISIRGIGNQAVGAAADSGTGTHFNGVYLNNGRIFETEFFDAERVEVLRGPQGTLYGRNTTAGVVNLITRKPEEDWGGNINLELGNYDHVKLKGALNIPLTDDLAQRFALFSLNRDGFVDNEYTGDSVDGRDMYALRSSTRWRGERSDVNLSVNYLREDSDRMRGSNQRCLRDPQGIIGCLPTGLANQRTNSAATVTGFLVNNLVAGRLETDFPDDDFLNSPVSSDPRKQYLDFAPRYEVEDWMASFEVEHAFDAMTLTWLTGYHRSKLHARNDYDFTVASEPWPVAVTVDRGPDGPITVDRAYASDRSTTTPEQWSQEIRLASDFDGDWNFMLGGFWLQYESEVHYYVYSAALTLYGETFGIPAEQRLFDNATRSYQLDTWATFGELYWQATDALRLTLGLRYTEEEKRSLQRTIYLGFLDDPNGPNGGYKAFEGSWEEPTGKFNVTWDIDTDLMAYLTLSRSYKSGGFNPISDDSVLLRDDPGLAEFDPEYINAFEVGLKSRLLDNTLQANLTYFYYDYDGLQISKITQQTSLNENFDAAIQGFEGEFAWLPTDRWRVTANLAWLDTAMDGGSSLDPADINQMGTTEFVVNAVNSNLYVGPGCPGGVPPCAGLEADLDGNALPNAPEFSVNLGLSYNWPLDNGMELTAAANYYWQDEFYTRVFNTVNDTVDAWDVWNATLTLYSTDRSWFAEAWGRNLNDEDHVTGQYLGDQNVGLATNQFLLEPRTFGVTLGYTF